MMTNRFFPFIDQTVSPVTARLDRATTLSLMLAPMARPRRIRTGERSRSPAAIMLVLP